MILTILQNNNAPIEHKKIRTLYEVKILWNLEF